MDNIARYMVHDYAGFGQDAATTLLDAYVLVCECAEFARDHGYSTMIKIYEYDYDTRMYNEVITFNDALEVLP